MESDPTRMCALLVGLPDVTVVGVGDWPHWLRIVIATQSESAGLLRQIRLVVGRWCQAGVGNLISPSGGHDRRS